MNRLLFAIVVSVVFATVTSAQTTQPATPPPLDSEKLEHTLLRQRVQRQEEEIAALRAQVLALAAQLESLGMEPAIATSRPSAPPDAAAKDARPRRVVFVLATDGREEKNQVARAVDELGPQQWFNVVVLTGEQSTPFQKQLVQPTELNRKKLREFLDRNFTVTGKWLTAFDASMRWLPQEIWFINTGGAMDDEDTFIRELLQLNAVARARVNTTIAYSRYGAPQFHHALWRIAAETGGVCVDAKGQPIDEPVLPIAAPSKPLSIPPPSILRSQQPQ